MANTNLHKAKSAKNDEFYTILSDIEDELLMYEEQFKNKVVYCNCDDARESNFFKFFVGKFKGLGLKKLITTSFNKDGKGTVLIYEGDKNKNGVLDDEEIIVNELNGNGDFRSEECLEFLKEADIVVTNPPFSLFKEYLPLLIDNGKKFCVIGNSNAITYKEIFPYFVLGKLWLGKHWVKEFVQPNGETKKFGNICWFTNFENKKSEDVFTLNNQYIPENYPKFVNYDAINVNKITEIPYDFDGVIGVPITIVDKVCSDGLIHFDTPKLSVKKSVYKIVGEFNNGSDNEYDFAKPLLKDGFVYKRIAIQKAK